MTFQTEIADEFDKLLRDLFAAADAAGSTVVAHRLGRAIGRAERLRKKLVR
jgi:hypothetical protein